MLHVLSLGGSIVSLKNGINVNFLKKFRSLIISQVERGDRFIIVVGGGSIARDYIKGATSIVEKMNSSDKDYLGIYSTYINAWLLKSIFENLSYNKLINNPNVKIRTNKPLIFSGGYLPGNSSDLVAVLLAQAYGVNRVVNLSNIDYVYDKDPKKFSDAKKIKEISWKDFLSLIGNAWEPGMNSPFDPIASKYCQKNNKEVVVLNGQDIKNLENYFHNQSFKGTKIFN